MGTRDFLVKAIKIGIVLVFLTFLVLGPFGLNLSEYPKAVFFRSLIEIIFVFYVFLILLNPGYLPKKSVLLFSIILFDAILIIASIAGINFYRSFFGEMQRGEGIILHLHLLAFFIILISVFRKKEDWLWLFKMNAIVSGLVSLAAILQLQKISLFYNVNSVNWLLSGTFSNSDLFGSYLVLSIFLAIFLLISEQKKSLKILWWSLIILSFFTLILSASRAAWIGFAFGIIAIYLLNYRNLSFKKRIGSLLIILFVSGLLFILPFGIERFQLKGTIAKRISSIYNIELAGRANLWDVSLAAFKDRPVLGWGFESYSYVSDKYFKNGYINGVYYDRPHNKLMEILVYAGALGITGYLLIFFVIFYLILKYAKLWDGYNNKSGIIFGSIIFAFFVAEFVQVFFGFDHIGTYILFFLVAGFVNNNFSNLPDADVKKSDNAMSAPKIIFGVLVAIFMVFVIYQVNIKPTIAAMYFPKYVRYESTDPATALDGYKQGVDMHTIYNNDLVLALADRSIYLLENGSSVNKEKAVEALLWVAPFLYKDIEAKDVRPDNVYEFLIRTDEWSYIARKDPRYLDQMQTDVNAAIAFNLNAPIFYQLRGGMEILQEKNNDGERDIKKSCKMDTFSCNGSETGADKMIGIAYYEKGDYESAVKNFQKALDADYSDIKKGLPSDISGVDRLTDLVAVMYYSYFKDFENSKKVYQQEMDAYPIYKNIFQQHLDMITADHKLKK